MEAILLELRSRERMYSRATSASIAWIELLAKFYRETDRYLDRILIYIEQGGRRRRRSRW